MGKVIKSKILRYRLKKIEEENKKEMILWWKKILPKRGSVLRLLVEKELINTQ